jgi:hypothetical protein
MAVDVLKILRSAILGNRPSGHVYGEPYVNFAENQFGVINNSGGAQDLIGVPIFSTTATYSAGQPVNHGGLLYIALGTVAAGAWNPTQWSQVATLASALVVRSYLAGLTLSTAGGVATFSVAAGQAANSTNTIMMNFPAGFTKSTSAWSAGNNGGALDAAAIAANTWYHVFLIERPDSFVTDILISLSATAPTIPSPYTLFRRIGAMKTDGSSNWIAFIQNGDEFLWVNSVVDVNGASLGTTPVNYPLSVPSGLKVNAILTALFANPVNGQGLQIYSPDVLTPKGSVAVTFAQTYNATSGLLNVRTDTASHVTAATSYTGSTIYIYTNGWIDRRGRDA